MRYLLRGRKSFYPTLQVAFKVIRYCLACTVQELLIFSIFTNALAWFRLHVMIIMNSMKINSKNRWCSEVKILPMSTWFYYFILRFCISFGLETSIISNIHFVLSRFSLRNIHDSQNSRGGGCLFKSSLPHLPASQVLSY